MFGEIIKHTFFDNVYYPPSQLKPMLFYLTKHTLYSEETYALAASNLADYKATGSKRAQTFNNYVDLPVENFELLTKIITKNTANNNIIKSVLYPLFLFGFRALSVLIKKKGGKA